MRSEMQQITMKIILVYLKYPGPCKKMTYTVISSDLREFHPVSNFEFRSHFRFSPRIGYASNLVPMMQQFDWMFIDSSAAL